MNPAPTCENRWRPRPGSPGFCPAPAVVLAKRPRQIGGNLNLCRPCYQFLMGCNAVTGMAGPPMPLAVDRGLVAARDHITKARRNLNQGVAA